MDHGFFLITGTSRGLGEALAQTILDNGHTVLGVSRSRSKLMRHERYSHMAYDLADTSRIDQIMEKVSEIVDQQRFDFACLVSCASAVEPIGAIEKCAGPAIEAHIRIGLITPMILASMFIQKFSKVKTRKKVAFISSRAAFTPLPEQSLYCSCKAGLNMLANCIGLEQKDREDGVEVISIGPGMVDTAMQQTLRSKTREEFVLADFFNQAYADGKLQEPGKVAEKIFTILSNKYEQGKYVSVSEV